MMQQVSTNIQTVAAATVTIITNVGNANTLLWLEQGGMKN